MAYKAEWNSSQVNESVLLHSVTECHGNIKMLFCAALIKPKSTSSKYVIIIQTILIAHKADYESVQEGFYQLCYLSEAKDLTLT